MPYMKRPLLLAALALIAFAALLNPAAAGEAAAMDPAAVDPAAADPAAAKSMDPEAEADALLMPTDAEADPAATDAAATEMDMEPDTAAAEEDGEPKLIGETLQAEPEFSTLVALVTAAMDETSAAKDDLAAEGPFTLFAPVNQAFTDFLTTSGLTVDEVLANPDLKEILAHHVVEGTPPIRPIGNPLPVEPSEELFFGFFGSDNKISLSFPSQVNTPPPTFSPWSSPPRSPPSTGTPSRSTRPPTATFSSPGTRLSCPTSRRPTA